MLLADAYLLSEISSSKDAIRGINLRFFFIDSGVASFNFWNNFFSSYSLNPFLREFISDLYVELLGSLISSLSCGIVLIFFGISND